jgi:hypothetical protein
MMILSQELMCHLLLILPPEPARYNSRPVESFTKREGKIINRRIGNPIFSECVQGTFDGGSSGERPYQLTFQLKLR